MDGWISTKWMRAMNNRRIHFMCDLIKIEIFLKNVKVLREEIEH